MKKITIAVFAILMIISSLVVLFSPYGRDEALQRKLIIEKITIDAPLEKVYQYLGDSENARDWSSYVDHISPLNSATHQDGKVGAIRRCFKNDTETGMMWDEEILFIEKDKKRVLSVFNMQGFWLKANHLLTEQLYRPINKNRCEVALTLYFEPKKDSFFNSLKMYFSAYSVSSIFQKNLNNIKELNESNQ